jgi:hypothetical protein
LRVRRALAPAVLVPFAAAVPFMILMPGRSHRGALPPLTAAQRELRDRLEAHVRRLAGEIGARNVGQPEALERSACWLEESLAGLGYAPGALRFRCEDREVRNVEAERRGRDAELVIVGAHYDSVGACPGANDNATGVAAALELARRFRDRAPARTIRFVFFVNEEPPHFQTEMMGSLVYARRCRVRQERVAAMLSLETLGCYAGRQRYPFPFSLFYPSEGNFVGFVGNLGSRALVRRAIGAFRRHAAFPSEGVAAPAWIPGIGWSDQWAFWEQGFPAVMVTDTAPYRYPHYHTLGDTPDRVDFEGLARVVDGLAAVVEELAGAA